MAHTSARAARNGRTRELPRRASEAVYAVLLEKREPPVKAARLGEVGDRARNGSADLQTPLGSIRSAAPAP
jgi:hypothetical protein